MPNDVADKHVLGIALDRSSPLTDSQRRLLDERLADEERNPGDVESWAKAKKTFSVSCEVRTPDQRTRQACYPPGRKWYEQQRKGLGKEFAAEVDAALERIADNPEQYEVVYRRIRHRKTETEPASKRPPLRR